MTINKIVTDDDLYTAADNAFAQGWTNVKMYFMVGQPTETHEDIEGIVTLAKRVREIGRKHHGGRARVRVSTSNFIPKAHTPFQWAVAGAAGRAAPAPPVPARRAEEGRRRVHVGGPGAQPARGGALARRPAPRRRRSSARGSAARASTPGTSTTTGRAGSSAMRGDRPRPGVLRVPRARTSAETFPWSHINIGVTESYLRSEWLKTLRQRDDARLPQAAVQRLRRAEPERRRLPEPPRPAAGVAGASRRRTAPGCFSRSRCSRAHEVERLDCELHLSAERPSGHPASANY